MTMPISFYGIIARIISLILPLKKNSWVFGSCYGKMYGEGSRYLLEYMRKEHPNYDCTFITRSKSVKDSLASKGIPCEMNFSLRGMIIIARAEVVFNTQSTTDVLFVYKKKGRKFIFLSHGQPYKAAFLATPKYYQQNRFPEKKGLAGLIVRLSRYLGRGYRSWESFFYTSTSDYLVPYNKMYYGENAPVLVLGMPRNDILFDDVAMSQESWLPNLKDKLVITYMPTHRDYGKGDTSPIPFVNNEKAKQWMKENNVVLLVKQHPNMASKITNSIYDESIIDITKMGFDSQVCLYHSDAIITDYSSVWIDYLLLKRPIVFYYYDDYITEDVGVLYDIKEDPPGPLCYSEKELFETLKRIKYEYKLISPSDRVVRKYHKYVDNLSCKRVYEAVIDSNVYE